MYNAEKLMHELPGIKDMKWDKSLGDFVDVIKKPHAFINEDGFLIIDGEYGDDLINYWDLGDPWIHPELERWAEKQGGYWEWISPGAVEFCED